MRWRQIRDRVWTWLVSPTFLFIPLVGLGLLLLLTLLIPQSPYPPSNVAAFSRWLAEVQVTLGALTTPLATLGWLAIRTSVWQRLALSGLVLAIGARTSAAVESWSQQSRRAKVTLSFLAGGTLLLLAGWGAQLRWGWIEPDITLWPEEIVTLPRRNLTLTELSTTAAFQRAGYGLYVQHQDIGLGVTVTAWDEEGRPVNLTASAQDAPQAQLRLCLTRQQPDDYFALPSEGLIFRATLEKSPPDPQIQVEIYSSASEELLNQTIMRGDGMLFTEELRLELESVALPQVRVIYNPGAPLSLLGWLGLLSGTALSVYEHSRSRDAAEMMEEASSPTKEV